MQQPVTVFYSADEGFAPILAVSLTSLVANSNPKREYDIYILSRGITDGTGEKLINIASSHPSVYIELIDIDTAIVDELGRDGNTLYTEIHTITIYFRLFIAQLFPHINRGIYVDSDTVFESDVADLFDVDLQGNLVGAVVDPVISSINPDLRHYALAMVGVPAEDYVNSGVLLMDLAGWREFKVAEHFMELFNHYHVRSIAADQDYINAMFEGRIYKLPFSWDVMLAAGVPIPEDSHLFHWNLVNKPWEREDVAAKEIFWKYASDSVLVDRIHKQLSTSQRTAEDDKQRQIRLIADAQKFSQLPLTFCSLKEQGVQVTL